MKVKHHGEITKNEICSSFKRYGFIIDNYNEKDYIIIVIAKKDYTKNFNEKFEGTIVIECVIFKGMYDYFCSTVFPIFKEISNIIPKDSFHHINLDGSICYTPNQRPLIEKWEFKDFVNSIDSFFNDYFSIEYIGQGKLFQLEHGVVGLQQYNYLKKSNEKVVKQNEKSDI